MTIWTIGHSNRSLDELVGLLAENRIVHLADVRSMPRSRRNPHFDRERLAAALEPHGIVYTHLQELGGMRKPRPDSPNLFWRHGGFRGYADHMATPEFEAGLERLLALAGVTRVAAMCAEAMPFECHRSLLADALVARGVDVEHILGPGSREAHQLRREARVEAGRVVYPGPATQATLELGGA